MRWPRLLGGRSCQWLWFPPIVIFITLQQYKNHGWLVGLTFIKMGLRLWIFSLPNLRTSYLHYLGILYDPHPLLPEVSLVLCDPASGAVLTRHLHWHQLRLQQT